MTTERGNRGKSAEKEVEGLFQRWNQSVGFAWHRMPDARAARGRLAAQPADYCWSTLKGWGWLEVKESKHDYRIAKDKVAQLPVLKKWRLAGALAYVLIHHTTIDRWRVVNVDDLTLGAPSWNLDTFPTFGSAEEALRSTGVF